ncbi:MAG: pilus assembly PilX N-terminal domain-containing protein [Phycisphaerae bacterium]|nr:pilus assembly PilX N-terminal domain-containing protein [Phycisphaerae bacterium]
MYCKDKSRLKRKHRGIALIISMIFIAIFSTLAMAMFTMSSNNTITANNFHQANESRVAAESGLEVIRYYLGQFEVSSTVSEEQWYSLLTSSLQDSMTLSGLSCAIDGTTFTIGSSQSPVLLGSITNRGFYAELQPGLVMTPNGLTDGITFRVTGVNNGISRLIEGGFTYGVEENVNSVFDFGVATKGPLSLQGNILLDGVNIAVESDVYIESMNETNALEIIGNSQIAGDVKIVNPDGTVTLQGGKAGIGGETGSDAIENHVDIGVAATEFPIPDTDHFEQYVTGITIDSSTDTSNNATYENIRIAAGTNPHFSGDVQLNGIIFIETPNVVTFSGNVDITGIIIGDGDVTDNSGTNQINITGNISSSSVSNLPVETYGELTEEVGTFMMAPGFAVSFGGSFGTLNGAIAANGVTFFGNAGGEIGGSILNYSDEPMTLSGNSDLYFNRSGITDIPAGFVPVYDIVIHYQPVSYSENIL